MDRTKIENYKLPDGSIYSGECIKNYSMIELNGVGEVLFPNGDKYIGQFEGGAVRGTGKYLFTDGDIHYGEFYNGIPNGIGYLNKHESMCMGNFKNGKLNGWAVRLDDEYHFGWWKDGQLLSDVTQMTNWAFQKLQNSKFEGTWARIFKSGMFGLGIPQKQFTDFVTPFFGYLFFKDGNVSLGCHYDFKRSGSAILFKTDKSIELAEYYEGEIVKLLTIQEIISSHLFKYPIS